MYAFITIANNQFVQNKVFSSQNVLWTYKSQSLHVTSNKKTADILNNS